MILSGVPLLNRKPHFLASAKVVGYAIQCGVALLTRQRSGSSLPDVDTASLAAHYTPVSSSVEHSAFRPLLVRY